jgi:phosphoglycolate phosphatase
MDLLIVTDLDDTIYNWLGFYIPSFRAMLREVEHISGISRESLVRSFRKVHQRHGTTEYAFALEELDVLPPVRTPQDLRDRLEQYGPAIRAFRDARKKLLRPHEGVLRISFLQRSTRQRITGFPPRFPKTSCGRHPWRACAPEPTTGLFHEIGGNPIPRF